MYFLSPPPDTIPSLLLLLLDLRRIAALALPWLGHWGSGASGTRGGTVWAVGWAVGAVVRTGSESVPRVVDAVTEPINAVTEPINNDAVRIADAVDDAGSSVPIWCLAP